MPQSWIAGLGRRYPRTHDLMSLVEDLLRAGEDVSSLDQLVDLNPFAVEYRYESLEPDDEPIDRDAFLQEVQDLFDHVAGKIGV